MSLVKHLFLAISVLTLGACGAINKPIAGQSQPRAADPNSATAQAAPAPTNMIEEFNDIPIPAELDRNDELSSIYEAPGVIVGVVVYEGFYKGGSIAKFFRSEMPKQEWQFLNAFNEGKRYTLAFLKANRSCMITIEEGSLATKVTVKVGPTGG